MAYTINWGTEDSHSDTGQANWDAFSSNTFPSGVSNGDIAIYILISAGGRTQYTYTTPSMTNLDSDYPWKRFLRESYGGGVLGYPWIEAWWRKCSSADSSKTTTLSISSYDGTYANIPGQTNPWFTTLFTVSGLHNHWRPDEGIAVTKTEGTSNNEGTAPGFTTNGPNRLGVRIWAGDHPDAWDGSISGGTGWVLQVAGYQFLNYYYPSGFADEDPWDALGFGIATKDLIASAGDEPAQTFDPLVGNGHPYIGISFGFKEFYWDIVGDGVSEPKDVISGVISSGKRGGKWDLYIPPRDHHMRTQGV
jgi:hypothetical protein